MRDLPLPLLQALSLPDTIVARTIPDRGVLEWTTGLLQILVLLLAVGALVTFILLLKAMREGVNSLNTTLSKLSTETQPLLASATAMVGDAREMVTMVRRDVEQVTDAAAAISDELLYAAESAAKRVDDVNAVLDVLQDQLEDSAISAVSALRGAQAGAQAFAAELTGKRRRRSVTRSPRTDAVD
ncbi:MAG: hypothetical protein IBJ03_19315 [Gemmatimonadaceae bacterium]|nr:hypothetical protein [Gemmatimonadaceae bacterium]